MVRIDRALSVLFIALIVAKHADVNAYIVRRGPVKTVMPNTSLLDQKPKEGAIEKKIDIDEASKSNSTVNLTDKIRSVQSAVGFIRPMVAGSMSSTNYAMGPYLVPLYNIPRSAGLSWLQIIKNMPSGFFERIRDFPFINPLKMMTGGYWKDYFNGWKYFLTKYYTLKEPVSKYTYFFQVLDLALSSAISLSESQRLGYINKLKNLTIEVGPIAIKNAMPFILSVVPDTWYTTPVKQVLQAMAKNLIGSWAIEKGASIAIRGVLGEKTKAPNDLINRPERNPGEEKNSK